MEIIDKIMKNIDKELLKRSFLYTYVIGLIAHGYGLLNLIISHDSLNDIYIASHQHKISIGRIWFPAYITVTHGKLVLPWWAGMLGFCWIALTVYLICRMFEVKESWMVLMISGIFTVNPTVISLVATFLNDLDADMFALLLAVGAVSLWNRGCLQNKTAAFLRMLAGAVILSFSIGLYQSYISVTITLVIILSLMHLLQGKESMRVIKNGMCAVGMLLAGGVFYLGEIKLVTYLTNTNLSSDGYNSITNMGGIFENSIGTLIGQVYGSWFETFRTTGFSHSPKIFLSIHLLLLAVFAVLLITSLKALKSKERLLFAVLLVVMPFGMNVCYFLSQGVLHDVMKFAFWFVYLFLILLFRWVAAEKNWKLPKSACFQGVIIGCLAFLVFGWMQTSNALYVKKDLQSQATLSRMTRVVEMMEEQEEYVAGETPVVFWGNNVGFQNSIPGFGNQSRIKGAEELATVTYQYTYETYFKYVLNTPIHVVFNKFHIVEEKIKDMPVFPEAGCVRMIDGILVVKFEEN